MQVGSIASHVNEGMDGQLHACESIRKKRRRPSIARTTIVITTATIAIILRRYTFRRRKSLNSATLTVFGVVALLTRARARRLAGAMCSVLVFTAISAPIDTVGARAGWWLYPSCHDPPHPPLPVYVGQALVFVGTIALIGWRTQRRFGACGLVALTVLVCGAGLARDLLVAALLPDVIRFGAMPASALADVVAWALVVFVALAVTRAIAGPAHADALRARP
jgi:hypothetical protein